MSGLMRLRCHRARVLRGFMLQNQLCRNSPIDGKISKGKLDARFAATKRSLEASWSVAWHSDFEMVLRSVSAKGMQYGG